MILFYPVHKGKPIWGTYVNQYCIFFSDKLCQKTISTYFGAGVKSFPVVDNNLQCLILFFFLRESLSLPSV